MRSLSSATLTALAKGSLTLRALVKVQLVEGTWGFWNDVGQIVVGGITYYGAGSLGSISVLPATINLSIPGFAISLSGLDTQVLNTFFGDTWHQQPITIYGALFDNTKTLVDTPFVAASGRMDKASVKGGVGQKGTLEISCEDVARRLTWKNPSVRSDGDQRRRSATDTFFQYVATTAQQQVYWGTKQPHPHHAQKSIRGINYPIG